jgi:hypothetical protein
VIPHHGRELQLKPTHVILQLLPLALGMRRATILLSVAVERLKEGAQARDEESTVMRAQGHRPFVFRHRFPSWRR